MPMASSAVTELTVVRPEARLMSSSVKATASTVRRQPTGAESGDEVAPVGEYLLLSVLQHSGPRVLMLTVL